MLSPKNKDKKRSRSEHCSYKTVTTGLANAVFGRPGHLGSSLSCHPVLETPGLYPPTILNPHFPCTSPPSPPPPWTTPHGSSGLLLNILSSGSLFLSLEEVARGRSSHTVFPVTPCMRVPVTRLSVVRGEWGHPLCPTSQPGARHRISLRFVEYRPEGNRANVTRCPSNMGQ